MSQSNKVTPNQVQEITKILNKNMGIFLKWLGTTYSPQYPQKEMEKMEKVCK